MSIEKGIFKSNDSPSSGGIHSISEGSRVEPKKTARMLDIEERTAVPIEDLIRDFYTEQKKSQPEIAQCFHISQRVLSQWMMELDIPRRLTSETLMLPETREKRNTAEKVRDFRIKSKVLSNSNPAMHDNILLDLYDKEGSIRRVFQIFKSRGNKISERRVARWIKDSGQNR